MKNQHSSNLSNPQQNSDIQEIRKMVFNIMVLSILTLATALLTLLGVVLK
jgi:hypothetical protein